MVFLFRSLRSDFKWLYSQIDMDLAYENVFELLWYSNLPCSGDSGHAIIKKCT